MTPLNYDQLEEFISENIVQEFYQRRLNKLRKLQLRRDILKKKNPYLFRAKNITTSETFIKSVLNAFLSSQEETMFGNLMEDLAIYICNQVFNGQKAKQGEMRSIDLEFTRDGVYYIVGIKSGTNWGNSDQIDRLKNSFKTAKDRLRSNNITSPIVAVNGCIYGRDDQPLKQDASDPDKNYYKYCGQSFWELISGEPDLYIKIIEPLGKEAQKRDLELQDLYDRVVNKMTKEFSDNFLRDGAIDWHSIIEFVSKK